ncbi:hypothetical protein BU16DRAFT_394462 [Lophium mytilinum]|uniref:F-box domain-containing protein n=1 Tax=Lophium mytilinum TaxID=390894 RepID=A0A6A6QT87_9PEZI|nr:hypothetical protein BU16DRAFT_394462 [Lophium mytilinum]
MASSCTRYNHLTGRPIRRGAGQKRKDDGYVDSVIIEDDIIPVESCSEDEDGNPTVRKVSKRKRTPSPTPPPLDALIDDDLPPCEESDDEDQDTDTAQPIELTFHIPPGFKGPLVVRLDHKLLATAGADSSSTKHSIDHGSRLWFAKRHRKTSKTMTKRPAKVAAGTHRPSATGFLKLPPELRNKIYKLLFVSQSELRFNNPQFSLSSAFLRTCKQVHDEGRSILYGEGTFVFERNRLSRSPFWDPVAKEIGYKDMRRFLTMIGDNLALLRQVRVVFEDATPSSLPYVRSQEERRFIHDEHLIECLRILRRAELKKFTLCFHGRKTLTEYDGASFLGRVCEIQADKVDIISNPRCWYMESKIHYTVKEPLVKSMTRDTPLYTVK